MRSESQCPIRERAQEPRTKEVICDESADEFEGNWPSQEEGGGEEGDEEAKVK